MTNLTLSITIAGVLSGLTTANAASPLDSTAPTPPLTYASVFADYRTLADVEPKPWAELNDTVRSVGGHSGSLASKTGGAAPKMNGSRASGGVEVQRATSKPSDAPVGTGKP
jgi:hypothetical protein